MSARASGALKEAVPLESPERFRRLLDGAPVALVVCHGEELGVEYANLAASELLELPSPARLRGRSLRCWVEPDSLATLREAARTAGDGSGVGTIDCAVRSASGELRTVEASYAPAPSFGAGAVQLALRDVTEERRASASLLHDATHDGLTGLPNRAVFRARAQQALIAERGADAGFVGVLFLDVDRFKSINDRLGHLAGDQVLATVARHLQECVRPGDTVSRFGGDEFIILLAGLHAPEDAVRVATRITRALDAPVALEGRTVRVSVSIGIVVAPAAAGHEPEELLRHADRALYRAKEEDPGRFPVVSL